LKDCDSHEENNTDSFGTGFSGRDRPYLICETRKRGEENEIIISTDKRYNKDRQGRHTAKALSQSDSAYRIELCEPVQTGFL
jgi:hypothetical protein